MKLKKYTVVLIYFLSISFSKGSYPPDSSYFKVPAPQTHARVKPWFGFKSGASLSKVQVCSKADLSQFHKGKTIEQWVKIIEDTGYRYHCDLGVKALKEIEPEKLIPILRQLLRSNDTKVRYNAVYMLGKIGSEAESAVDDLLVCLRHDDYYLRSKASGALGLIKQRPDECIPALVDLLSDETQMVRLNAIESIGDYGSQSIPYYDDWKIALYDHNDSVSRVAMRTMIAAGVDEDELVRQFGKQLEHPDSWVKKIAAWRLGNRRAAAKEFIPRLRQLLMHEDEGVQLASAIAIGKISPSLRSEVMPSIVRFAKHKKEYIHMKAMEALFEFAPKEYPIMPKLLSMTKSPKMCERLTGVDKILKLDSTWITNAIPILEEALESDDLTNQCRAAYKLGKLGIQSVRSVPKLKKLLTSIDEDVRGTAKKALILIEQQK